MIDKSHKETDKMLNGLELALKKMYSLKFAKLKKEIKEVMIEMNFSKDLTPIERYNLAQKYNRLEKLEESVAKAINETNKDAVNIVNSVLTDVYNENYNSSLDLLGVLLAIQIPKSKYKELNKTEIKQEQSPYDILAINEVKDLDGVKRSVNRQFVNAIMRGDDINKLINHIKEVTELKLSEITRIARTQTTRIENEARLKSYKAMEDLGHKVVKTWVAVGDNRTRHAHNVANGQTVEIDKPFIVGGEELMFPGDPNGSPGNIINCRCYMRASVNNN